MDDKLLDAAIDKAVGAWDGKEGDAYRAVLAKATTHRAGLLSPQHGAIGQQRTPMTMDDGSTEWRWFDDGQVPAGGWKPAASGLSGFGKQLFKRPKNIADALQKAHDSINKPAAEAAHHATDKTVFIPDHEFQWIDRDLVDDYRIGGGWEVASDPHRGRLMLIKRRITAAKPTEWWKTPPTPIAQPEPVKLRYLPLPPRKFDEEPDLSRISETLMPGMRKTPVEFKARTPEERDQQLKQAAAVIEKGMTEASVARAADHALAAVDERPDKNLEETKDFPNDYAHNRARDVIKGILDKSIKPGGIREIKRAVADREKDDDKGPKPFPSKALRLNAASWLTGR